MSEITPFVQYISSSRRVSCTYFLKAKVVCHESFYLHFFHDLCASYRGVRLCGVHHTAESDSAVCIIPRSQTPQCESHCRVMKTKYMKKLAVCIPPLSQAPFKGSVSWDFWPPFFMIQNHLGPRWDIRIKKNSVVCILLWSQTLRCASSRGVRFFDAHHTPVSDSAVCIIPRKQTPMCASHCGVMKIKYLKRLRDVR